MGDAISNLFSGGKTSAYSGEAAGDNQAASTIEQYLKNADSRMNPFYQAGLAALPQETSLVNMMGKMFGINQGSSGMLGPGGTQHLLGPGGTQGSTPSSGMLGPGGTQQSGGMSWQMSPYEKQLQQQALTAANRSAEASGMLGSGANQNEQMQRAANIASQFQKQDIGEYSNVLGNLINRGQSAAGTMGGFDMSGANSIAQMLANAGMAQGEAAGAGYGGFDDLLGGLTGASALAGGFGKLFKGLF